MYHHIPVLFEEVRATLKPKAGGVYVDGTLGGGGHSEILLEASSPAGRVLAFDLDHDAILAAREKLSRFGDRLVCIEDNFKRLGEHAIRLGVKKFDGVLLDLGVSSYQFDTPERGLSFLRDGPLDMRFSRDQTTTAAAIVNSWSEKELEKLFQELGEERFALSIAEAIVQARKRQQLKTTLELAEIVRWAVPPFARRGRIHPATRVFQSLRIAVNDELENLKAALPEIISLLALGGRVAIISFHSLEDRLVKHFFKEQARLKNIVIITKKPLTPSELEIKTNPRARSAKLRVAERI